MLNIGSSSGSSTNIVGYFLGRVKINQSINILEDVLVMMYGLALHEKNKIKVNLDKTLISHIRSSGRHMCVVLTCVMYVT